MLDQHGYSQQYGSHYDPGLPSASMSEILLEPLARLETLSHTLFQSLGPPAARPPPPPSVSELLAVDTQLAAAVQLAGAHQVKQRRIEHLKDEVLDLDRRWREIVRALDEGRRELDAIVREGEERIKSIEEAKAGKWCHSPLGMSPRTLFYASSRTSRTSGVESRPFLHF